MWDWAIAIEVLRELRDIMKHVCIQRMSEKVGTRQAPVNTMNGVRTQNNQKELFELQKSGKPAKKSHLGFEKENSGRLATRRNTGNTD